MLTFLALMILEQLHGLERRGTTNELVRELGFVIRVVIATILLVHLLVIVLSLVYGCISQQWPFYLLCQVTIDNGGGEGKRESIPQPNMIADALSDLFW